MSKQLQLDIHRMLIVDLFAGAGGMSLSFEEAFGRSPDIAINHNEDALSMHRMNHPQTRHFIADVFEVCPRGATQGRPVGWLHLSPDCTHHSQASAGQPRNAKIRGLSWVGARWGGQVRPVCISLENVKQILKWGPLIAKRDKATGRVVTLEKIKCPTTGKLINRIADIGEQVKLQNQFLVPNPKCLGETWRRFVRTLEAMGYVVETRMIRAADRGGHTTRERLFMIARCDGQPIVWPEIKHFKKPSTGQMAYKPAHECLEFWHKCPSIFDRERPLAPNTLKRLAKGIKKFVIDVLDPYTIPPERMIRPDWLDKADDLKLHAIDDGETSVVAPLLAKIRGDSHGARIDGSVPTITSGGNMKRDAGSAHALGLVTPILVQAAHGEGQPGRAQRWGDGSTSLKNPLGAITASGGHAVAVATLIGVGGPEYSGKPISVEGPIGTLMTENHRGLATAYLMQANDGFNTTPGHSMDESVSSVTSTGSQQQLVTANLAVLRNNCIGGSAEDPISAVAAGGEHQALVSTFLSRQFGQSVGHSADDAMAAVMATGGGKSSLVECTLSPDDQAGALRVAAFLIEYYSEGGQWADLRDPMNTLTTRERMALVTVTIKGTPYVIVDIGLRMLKPRELFNAQDFPASYIIDRGHDGRKFNVTKQVRMVGNSVDPLMAVDFLKLNAPELASRKAA